MNRHVKAFLRHKNLKCVLGLVIMVGASTAMASLITKALT